MSRRRCSAAVFCSWQTPHEKVSRHANPVELTSECLRVGDFRVLALAPLGAILANLIGTTGASVLLIRPVLRINRQRKFTRHLPIFFIFIVSNIGGLLTPLGDPPLFLGLLN